MRGIIQGSQTQMLLGATPGTWKCETVTVNQYEYRDLWKVENACPS